MLGFEFIAIGAITCCLMALVVCASTPPEPQIISSTPPVPQRGNLIINGKEGIIQPPTYEEATVAPPKFSDIC